MLESSFTTPAVVGIAFLAPLALLSADPVNAPISTSMRT